MRTARTVSVVGELLITAGVFILLFVGWELWWTDVTANRAQSATVHRLVNEFAGKGSQGTVDPGDVPVGDAFAIIRIPRFGADYARPVYKGTTHDILTEGFGQYTGTAQPGAVGNFSLAGHRTTYGRPLHDVQTLHNGDKVVVETSTEFVVYTVVSHEIVAPDDIAVIAPVPDQPTATASKAYLTLTTCHPAYSAQQRYIVHALLDKVYPRAGGLPRDVLTVPGKG